MSPSATRVPAKDIYHDTVKHALVKDGWAITHDPLKLKWGKKDLFIDLGAEQLLAAQKEESKIAVEIKSFVGRSDVADRENALGQYVLYHNIRPLAKVNFRPPQPPNFGGRIHSKSSRIGGFRGHSRIYARGLF